MALFNKKQAFLVLIMLGLLMFHPAKAQEGFENIDAYWTLITINSDSSISVREKIDYNFNDLEGHGIFRNIPVKYSAGLYNRNIRISEVSVIANQQPVNFETSRDGRDYVIKIGDADVLVTGLQKYEINYKISGAINYFDDHDELYWNAIGGKWEVAIQDAVVTVMFPAIEESALQTSCYIGLTGENTACGMTGEFIKSGQNIIGLTFAEPFVNMNEFMTVVIGLPKGEIYQPTFFENTLSFLRDNWSYGLPVLALIGMFYLWLIRGRDPKGRGTVIPEYEAPDNLTPVEVGTIYDQSADNKDVSAQIIYLATKGYIKITQIEKQGIFGKQDYRLDQLKQYDDLAQTDQSLLKKLFSHGKNGEHGIIKTVLISELKEKFHSDLSEYTKSIYQSLVDTGYFPESPAMAKGKYLILGGVIFFISVWAAFIPLAISGAIIALFGLAMGRRTKKGAIAVEQINGLKLFLEVTEKDRIKFHNAPEKNPQLFEKFLPYAMVLGVEKQWAGQFADMFIQPSWYATSTPGTFNAMYLATSLGNFSSQTSSNLAATPASSGSSGFGGGGSSGGGFGGGGGGSW